MSLYGAPTATSGVVKRAACLTVAALLATSTVTSALTFGGQECATTDPIATVDLSAEPYAACVTARCLATTGAEPSAISADGQCDGSGAAEAASTASCEDIFTAFSTYYACVLREMHNDEAAPAEVRDAYQIYLSTPGAPYAVSEMPCYSCTNFDAVFAAASLPATCQASATCENCCGQNPTTNWIGSPGKGYNHVLCGTGCITALMMMAFTIMSALIFCSCGLCWPSPSLKTTVERLRREEEEERARAAAAVSSDDDRAAARQAEHEDRADPLSPARHEPVDDGEYPTEPHAQEDRAAPAGSAKHSEDEL